MRGHRVARLALVALTLGMLASVPLAAAAAPNRQDEPLQIVFSVPGLNFPFFLHMMNIAETKAAEPGIERDGHGRPTGRIYGADEWLRARLPGSGGGRRSRQGQNGSVGAWVAII